MNGDEEGNCKVLKDSSRRPKKERPRNCFLFSPLLRHAQTALTDRRSVGSDTAVPLTVSCLEVMCGPPNMRAIMHIRTITVYNLTPM